ncbi:Rex2p Ecym_1507 [Eremothecium cymbalariae DBVPG|uniref:Exonuclease domain-containing protein n=1 Tax=Eremothecium cymbalariae (strain CBS 270.75 / DBVPG 7215 / KCTC 17166 / NRRL Y-17582) TaxID=931890 RepID=G8JMR6_ERECY|nr:hypothetical protein Ecym_1507 [Eremothecium cymbalariae DBVPG\
MLRFFSFGRSLAVKRYFSSTVVNYKQEKLLYNPYLSLKKRSVEKVNMLKVGENGSKEAVPAVRQRSSAAATAAAATTATAISGSTSDASTRAEAAASKEMDAKATVKSLFKPIVWIDCEMTGLDHTSDQIIEVCCIITDGNLGIVDSQGYESVVHYDKAVLDSMNEWCIEQHGNSGLTAKVLESKKTREQVEEELLAYIKKYIPEPRKGILAGNSVHMDRLFMLKDFPKVVEHLFYRLIDVSSIMEVCRRHNPALEKVMDRKRCAHTAKSDILESINQLSWYQQHYLKSSEETRNFVASKVQEKMKCTSSPSSSSSSYATDGNNEDLVKDAKLQTTTQSSSVANDRSELCVADCPIKKRRLEGST